MADLRNKIFGLAFTAVAFAGMAQAQTACVSGGAVPGFVRSEGTNEEVADMVITCGQAGSLAYPVGSSMIISVFVPAPLTITSKVLASATATTEAVIINNATGLAVVGSNGVLTNSGQLTFTIANANLIVTGTPTTPFSLTITNIRVNASALGTASGIPQAIAESIFLGGAAVQANAITGVNVAFVSNGLGTIRTSGTATGSTTTLATKFAVCNRILPFTAPSATGGSTGASALNPAFWVDIAEGYANAYKAAGTNAAFAANVGAAANTETNFNQAIAGITNIANTNTRLKVVFNNVPAGVNVYVPIAVSSATTQGGAVAAGGFIQLNSSEAGPFFSPTTVTGTSSGSTNGVVSAAISGTNGVTFTGVAPTVATPGVALNGVTAANTSVPVVQINSGAGTAVAWYDVQANAASISEFYAIPVYLFASPNTVAPSATAITTATSFAPVGAAGSVPNFVVGGTTATQNASTFFQCTTSLLFPFLTNTLGFDTGIAISNTSTDPFGAAGATPGAGTCALNFYGSGAPSPSNVTTPSVASGSTYTFVVSSVASGFSGYMIAQCQFQFAHGFAFITDGVGPNGGLSQGYLAGVIPDTNQVNRGVFAAPAGTTEALGN